MAKNHLKSPLFKLLTLVIYWLNWNSKVAIRITGGKACGRLIVSPKGKLARPTSSKIRQAVFNILAGRIVNANFLDIFAGSGIMGLEALSRGANELTSIELNRKMAQYIDTSLTTLEYEANLIVKDARIALKNLEKHYFDVIFADPPYQTNLAQSTIYLIDRNQLLNESGVFIIEHSINTNLELSKTALRVTDRRIYGQTAISFIERKEESNDPE